MNSGVREERQLLAFLGFHETTSHDGYLGSILISDLNGVPQEFRCTYPVKPTTIQKSLYGNSLLPHIGIQLCGIPLIESIQQKPSLIIVKEKFLLGVRKRSAFPVIFVRRAGEAIDLKGESDSAHSSERQRIDSPVGRFQPIVFLHHPDFQDDRSVAHRILEIVTKILDPLEPFERAAKALEMLRTQDSRFQ
jgi:hypothetical protein